MIKLSNFANLFEVSIALHLAYSFLKGIHNGPLAKIGRKIETLKLILKNKIFKLSEDKKIQNKNNLLQTMLTNVDFKFKGQLIPYQKFINKYIRLSIMVAIFSITWLAVGIFLPEYSVSTFHLIIVLVISFLPMPIFILLTHQYIKKETKDITETLDNIMREIEIARRRIGLNSFARSLGMKNK